MAWPNDAARQASAAINDLLNNGAEVVEVAMGKGCVLMMRNASAEIRMWPSDYAKQMRFAVFVRKRVMIESICRPVAGITVVLEEALRTECDLHSPIERHTRIGEVEILRFVAAHDRGSVTNRLTYDNQVFGGTAFSPGSKAEAVFRL